MDRKIIFKGKHIHALPQNEHHDGTWVYGYLCDESYINTVDEDEYGGKFTSEMLIDPETVCQYTGLTDKNGRKIFEGDIITYQHDNDDCPFSNKDTKRRIGRVYFQEFRSCFAVAEGKNGSDMINQDLFKYVQNGNRVEVIGNIFDNPELMEV